MQGLRGNQLKPQVSTKKGAKQRSLNTTCLMLHMQPQAALYAKGFRISGFRVQGFRFGASDLL